MLHFKNLYIDKDVKDYKLVKDIKSKVSYDNLIYVSGEQHPGKGLLLTLNKGSFVKPCPGQKGSVCCGYWVVEWGMGCPFGCEYCILQNYTGAGDITLFVNWEDCKKEIEQLRQKVKGPIRLGTGQFGDPLALEEIFPLNTEIIEWTKDFADFTLEIKTKSDQIQAVLNAENAEHVTLAFSLNPQWMIDKLEHGAASLHQRLDAAATAAARKKCALAFHFDPVLPLGDWENDYKQVFELMKQKLSRFKINWISVGTFRFPKGFEAYVEEFHPGSEILDEEFYRTEDGKLRYFRPFREKIYKFAFAELKNLFPDTAVYICMDMPYVWQRIIGNHFYSSDLKILLDKRI
ncbi:MAG: radical SAM protein [Candidatus Rifleibacteriota bacterium]